jgi:hypothetical protein
MKALFVCAALATAAPAFAQAEAPAPAPAASTEIDPARLALARTSVDAVWPLGTYARMMRGTMDAMTDKVMESMFDMKVDDLVPGEDPKHSGLTMRDAMMKEDPHFVERMRITNHVMLDEMIPLMSRFEPAIREGLSRAYARKFTAEQLADLNRFFATPTGRFYASESMLTMADPEIMAQMTRLAPEIMREMPRIMEKVKAATAHLPPPRKPAPTRR